MANEASICRGRNSATGKRLRSREESVHFPVRENPKDEIQIPFRILGFVLRVI